MSHAKSIGGVMGPRSTSGRMNLLIQDLADRQYGHVARRQLLAAGLSPGQIRHRVRSGYLVCVYAGVYAVGHRPQTRSSRFMAAVLAAGVDAALSHGSAAAHRGIRGWGGGPIHVSAPRKICRDRRICAHQARLPPDEVSVIDAIPTTGISRTLFDLAGTLGAEAFQAALRQAEFLRATDTLTLADLLERHPRRRGASIVRAALESGRFGAVRTRSGLELGFLAFLDARGLPLPEVNALIEAGGRTYEADAAYRAAQLIVELDDFSSHGTTSAFESDRARDRALLLAGWRTIRVTPAMLGDGADELERDLRALLFGARS